jgi:hypothetical protein
MSTEICSEPELQVGCRGSDEGAADLGFREAKVILTMIVLPR